MANIQNYNYQGALAMFLPYIKFDTRMPVCQIQKVIYKVNIITSSTIAVLYASQCTYNLVQM